MNKLQQRVQLVTEVRENLKQILERKPTFEEIAKEAKIEVNVVRKILLPVEETNSATIQFFAIYEKGKRILVLPRLLNTKFMTGEELNALSLGEGMSGSIVIPNEPKRWSKISIDADHLFLALQSRMSWGSTIDQKTNLLKVDQVRDLVIAIEESLNDYSWRKDFLSGRFGPGDLSKPISQKKSIPLEKETLGEGIDPGQNWQV